MGIWLEHAQESALQLKGFGVEQQLPVTVSSYESVIIIIMRVLSPPHDNISLISFSFVQPLSVLHCNQSTMEGLSTIQIQPANLAMPPLLNISAMKGSSLMAQRTPPVLEMV